MVLAGYLDEDYYQHHLLLVEAVYLLLMDKISDQDIIQSERLLKHYCFLLAPLYGMSYLTYDTLNTGPPDINKAHSYYSRNLNIIVGGRGGRQKGHFPSHLFVRVSEASNFSW